MFFVFFDFFGDALTDLVRYIQNAILMAVHALTVASRPVLLVNWLITWPFIVDHLDLFVFVSVVLCLLHVLFDL